MRLVTLATCNLDQWALDFDGNLSRILASVRAAKERGARYRIGPELEVCGYGCEDHFLEEDTSRHSWECLAEIIRSGVTDDILCDFGLPIIHHGVRYNCRAIVLNGKILLIRPKLFLAQDGNYREERHFKSWTRRFETQMHLLPSEIQEITGQEQVPFGEAILELNDAVVGCETCEELFAPDSPHSVMWLNGVDIVGNGSGSHHQLRKLDQRIRLIQNATAKCGGVYLYANQQGCDGGRLYFDGCAMICFNGDVVGLGSQFSLNDIEVITSTVDLDEVQSLRAGHMSFSYQAAQSTGIPRIRVDFCLSEGQVHRAKSAPLDVTYHKPEEEIALGPACWMWDYLRRSGASGFFLPLSGGADSSSVCALVGSMCQLVVAAIRGGNEQVLNDVRRVVRDETYVPEDPRELVNRILHTTYMGTKNSSSETCSRSARLAEEVGSYHLDVRIDPIIESLENLFENITGKRPQFKVHGGSWAENQALQNIQARERMVLAFMLAQLLPWTRDRSGFLLVLGSANVDEGLRGYLTKYDCSSADINPIGSISKRDIRRFLCWAGVELGYPTLLEIEQAPPTAELEPITDTYVQKDEEDMGMTYDELSEYGRLRKIYKCGPVSMFERLVSKWQHLSVPVVAEKVKFFFKCYSQNRHKMTVLTPSYHAENYSPEDNRFDLRQFLYNSQFPWQFGRIDQLVQQYKQIGESSAIASSSVHHEPAIAIGTEALRAALGCGKRSEHEEENDIEQSDSADLSPSTKKQKC